MREARRLSKSQKVYVKGTMEAGTGSYSALMRPNNLACAGGFCVLALILLAGCGTPFNNRNVLGEPRLSVTADDRNPLSDRTVQLPAVSINARNDAGRAPEEKAGQQPAIGTSLSRAEWERTTILVPIDGVEGYPSYMRYMERTAETSRQRNEFPTPMTALELDGDTDAQYTESIVGPATSLASGALMPFRMMMHRPWQAVRHVPQPGYRAAPATKQTSTDDLARLRSLDTPLNELTGPVGAPVKAPQE